MRLSEREFMQQEAKAVTLLGMSGVGKTHLSRMLAEQGWVHYSCDYLIGTKYMRDELAADAARISKKDISNLSAFIGKPGDPAKGGLDLAEYKRRQNLYYEAECQSLRDVIAALKEAGTHNFVNDSTGSLCEIRDDKIVDEVGKRTLFVYIKASREEEKRVLERARRHPKPMYFPPDRFDEWLAEYMKANNVATVAKLDPDEFSRWVFQRLFEARLPKYQRLADRHGVTIPSDDFRHVKTEKDFTGVIAAALGKHDKKAG
jgi:hypothetical protein